jgi:hypothetical protein
MSPTAGSPNNVLVLGLIIAAFVGLMVFISRSPTPESDPSKLGSGGDKFTVKVGDQTYGGYLAGDVGIAVWDVSDFVIGRENDLDVRLVITNRQREKLELFDNDFQLIDQSGNIYSAGDNDFSAVGLNPGLSAWGNVTFPVPSDVAKEQLRLRFKAGISGDTVDLPLRVQTIPPPNPTPQPTPASQPSAPSASPAPAPSPSDSPAPLANVTPQPSGPPAPAAPETNGATQQPIETPPSTGPAAPPAAAAPIAAPPATTPLVAAPASSPNTAPASLSPAEYGAEEASLEGIYEQLLSQVKADHKADLQLRLEQSMWLNQRISRCRQDTACQTEMAKERIDELSARLKTGQ